MTTKFLSLEELAARAPSVTTRMPTPEASTKYTHVNTLEMAEMLGELGWLPVRAREQLTQDPRRRGFQKHEVAFRHSRKVGVHQFKYKPTDHRVEMDNADEVFELIIHNSHDARSPWRMFAGMMVQVCANGLVISRNTFEEIRIPHVNITRGEILTRVIKASEQISDIMMVKDEMKLIELPEVKRLDFAERALLLKYHDMSQSPVGPAVTLNPCRKEDTGNSLWKTYQVVQENIMRGMQRDHSRLDIVGRPYGVSIPVTSIDRSRVINQGLWDIALSYMNN